MRAEVKTCGRRALELQSRVAMCRCGGMELQRDDEGVEPWRLGGAKVQGRDADVTIRWYGDLEVWERGVVQAVETCRDGDLQVYCTRSDMDVWRPGGLGELQIQQCDWKRYEILEALCRYGNVRNGAIEGAGGAT